MSLNFHDDEGSIPIACVGKRKLYLNDKETQDGFTHFKLPAGHEFSLAHDTTNERQIVYITAPSGAGKSYMAKQYIMEYHKHHPKNAIYVFSSLPDDKTLDTLKYLKRIKINNPEFKTIELTAEDFKDSLVLFDDVDVIIDKLLLKKVQSILNSILQIGRHYNVSCIYTSHKATAGKDTAIILNEAHVICLFPSTSGGKMLDYVGGQYLGLSKKQLEKLKDIKSRWACVIRKYPRAILTQHEAYLMSHQ